MHRRLKGEQKSTRGSEPKGMQKSDKKSALIPYLDNIEITSIKIFAKTPEIWGKIKDLLYNGFFSVVGSTLIYDRILWDKKKREFEGTLFYNLRKVVK